MRSLPSRLRWSRCEEFVLALVATVLLVLVLSAECDRRERAVWLAGYRLGVQAQGQPARWGSCWREGRSFPCARLPSGELIEVRLP